MLLERGLVLADMSTFFSRQVYPSAKLRLLGERAKRSL